MFRHKATGIGTPTDEVQLRAFAQSARYRRTVTVRGSELAQIIEGGLQWRDRCLRAERDLDQLRVATGFSGRS